MANDRFIARTKSFTRRSREMSAALIRAFEAGRDEYLVDVPRGEGLTSVSPDFLIDPDELFGRVAPLLVEVGPGRGEQLLHSAALHPEINFLAFEVWEPGVARIVSGAAKENLTNVRVIEADAQQALKTILPESSVSEMWTFFPDPWRKARHKKRRLVAADFAGTVSRVLQDGALWRLATDWTDYAAQMLQVLEESPELENPYPASYLRESEGKVELAVELEDLIPNVGGYSPRFTGRVETHFEERGKVADRLTFDLTAVRMPRSKSDETAEGSDKTSLSSPQDL